MIVAAAGLKPFNTLLLIAVVLGLIWYTQRQARQALVAAEQKASTIANAPLQAFRDPNADGSTVGTQAWAYQKVDDLKRWLGIEQPQPNPNSPYQPGPPSVDELPAFEAGVIVPYQREGM